MIVPITLVLAVYTTRKTMNEKGSNYSIKKIFPWFVLGFVLTAIVNTFVHLPQGLPETLVMIGKFMIVMAMTAIGLNTNLKKLLTNGLKPICLGLSCWFVVAVVSLIVQKMIGMI